MEFKLLCAALLGLSLLTSPKHGFQQCLPEDTKLTDVVSASIVKPGARSKKINVEQTLIAIKAKCKKGKLVDASGKEIRFYRLTGCWGNPPADYQEILARQAEEIEKLKKQYTVIEMTCNPDGALLH
jgi:hypothetical protein